MCMLELGDQGYHLPSYNGFSRLLSTLPVENCAVYSSYRAKIHFHYATEHKHSIGHEKKIKELGSMKFGKKKIIIK